MLTPRPSLATLPPTRPAARPNARRIGDLVGPALDPVCRKRGFAQVDIFAWWPDVVGRAYADKTRPERIRWPRPSETGSQAAILFVRCDPSVSLQLAHESGQIRERLNRFLGFSAIGAVRIVQHPVSTGQAPPASPRNVERGETTRPDLRLAGLDAPLARSLAALGRNAFARR